MAWRELRFTRLLARAMKLVFALSGFHRYDRGAEVALLSIASELAATGDDVTVVGSGPPRPGTTYRYLEVPAVARERFERFPTLPPFRSETAWEDATFAFNLMRKVRLHEFDATLTCSFPFTHWALRRLGRNGPANVFVTQNGDWPAFSDDAEYGTFSCDGLVCTNPDYLARNEARWHCALIPNGVDLRRFKPGRGPRDRFRLPTDRPVVLMVSALIESKRVLDGIRAVARLQDAHLIVAGDGPLRQQVIVLGQQLLPGRFSLVSLSSQDMPDLYRSADVFLHLSHLESFGNVFLEAWASGIPIVAHDSDRLRWILGNGQFLCDTSDTDQLESTIRMATTVREPDLRDGVERFSWTTIASQYRAFTRETIVKG